MEMYDPPSPGEFINTVYLEPAGLSYIDCAQSLGLPPSTLEQILDGSQSITPELAEKLSHGLGSSPESWLRMQEVYDAWQRRISVAGNVVK
ncbi:HigA family addiction module antitoxin [Pseudoduganella aquatica]|uniref:HigA family addiction module antidote protein n=1 Tax=Pseudoduganella aquatica TaxID=2660641 RepID=A0A7X4H6T0_9BURK|nr:HigA family addiction module antitoxin [Pseudoduganella aquatica]MYN05781.1 HigA family addiction module antidote protein [Pseudoduganella aquatica]